jgi:LDH2 family malate/lactate/ureidoglycolate dehydrogenase
LIAYTLGIPTNRDQEHIARVAASIQVAPFVPKIIKVEVPGEDNKNQNEQPKEEAAPEDEEVLAELLKYL